MVTATPKLNNSILCRDIAWASIVAFCSDEGRKPQWREDWEERDVETDSHVLMSYAADYIEFWRGEGFDFDIYVVMKSIEDALCFFEVLRAAP